VDRALEDRASALELLLGGERFGELLLPSLNRWLIPMAIMAGTALAIIHDAGALSTARELGIAAILVGTFPVLFLAHVFDRSEPGRRFSRVGLVFGTGAVVAVWLASPAFEIAVAVLPTANASAALFLRRRDALRLALITVGGYALMVAWSDGYPLPAARVLIVAAFALSSMGLFSWSVELVERLATEERRLAAELAAAHARLEVQVAEQVAEIGGLSRLQRFLSPQVARAVLSADDEALLAPHRRRIAVWFVDLRGFTAFNAGAEPEDVVEVLDEYFALVGRLVHELDATVGNFTGDGVMGYFNDPFPHDDPAGAAVELGTRFQDGMRTLIDRWAAHGHRLGAGVGITYGYATLGTVGFEGRADYTALGSVVNLAARLCGEAADGEILLDARAHDAVAGRVGATPVTVVLKGFAEPVTAYRLGA
jgi:class 3 adenylate cyclase